MNLKQALEYAMSVASLPTTSASGKKQKDAAARPGPLTRREREVAVLIAQGLSNRAIAARLFADPAYRDLSAAIMADPAQFTWLITFQANQFGRGASAAMRERAQLDLVLIIRDQFVATPGAATAFMSLTRELHSEIHANTRRLPELSEFRPPVGLIWGAGDPYLNVGVAEHLLRRFRREQLTRLPFGHWLQIDGPEEVAHAPSAAPRRSAVRSTSRILTRP